MSVQIKPAISTFKFYKYWKVLYMLLFPFCSKWKETGLKELSEQPQLEMSLPHLLAFGALLLKALHGVMQVSKPSPKFIAACTSVTIPFSV